MAKNLPKKKPPPKPRGNPLELNDARHYPRISDGWGPIRDRKPWGPGAPGWPGKKP